MIQTKYKHIVHGVYEQKCEKELSISNLSFPSHCELWYITFLLKMLVKRMYFHILHGMGGDLGVGAWVKLLCFNPVALRTAKTLWSLGCSECNRVNLDL